ncbi:MAG: hypothetical protein ABIH72_05665 [archaeon]
MYKVNEVVYHVEDGAESDEAIKSPGSDRFTHVVVYLGQKSVF